MAIEPKTREPIAHTSETHAHPQHSNPVSQRGETGGGGEAPSQAQTQMLERGKADKDRIMKDYQERMKGRPTPTQEECDKIKLGMNPEMTPDGSDPDVFEEERRRQSSAEKPGEYKTREMAAR